MKLPIKKELATLTERTQEIDRLFMSLYEDKAKGILTEQRFVLMTKQFEQEQNDGKERMQDVMDMPMLLYTFFDANDFSGKTIIPFNTHGGSGFSGTIGTIAELEPNATVNEEGFTVSRNDTHNAAPDVLSWLNKLGY